MLALAQPCILEHELFYQARARGLVVNVAKITINIVILNISSNRKSIDVDVCPRFVFEGKKSLPELHAFSIVGTVIASTTGRSSSIEYEHRH